MSKIEVIKEEAINLTDFKDLNIGDYFVKDGVLYVKCIQSTSNEFSMEFNSIILSNGCLGCFNDDSKVKVVDVKIMYC